MPSNQSPNLQEQRYLRVLYFLLFAAFLFQLAGLAGPGWIVVSVENVQTYIGMWFAIVCTDLRGTYSECEVISMTLKDNRTSNNTSSWTEYQILTTVATATCLLTFIVLVCARQSSGYAKFIVVSVFSPVSAACPIIAAVKVADAAGMFEKNSPFKFPWALLLTGIGGIVSVLTMIFNIYFMSKMRTQQQQQQQQQRNNVVPTSENAPRSQNYQGGYTQDYGYPGYQQQPAHMNQSYGMGSGNELYPNLNLYNQPAGSGYTYGNPGIVPSAPPAEF